MYNEQEIEIEIKISKAGKNLFGRIPDKYKEQFGRGDKIRITLLERAKPKNPETLKPAIEELINHPNGEKLRGKIGGYNIQIPLSKIITALGTEKSKDMMLEAVEEL